MMIESLADIRYPIPRFRLKDQSNAFISGLEYSFDDFKIVKDQISHALEGKVRQFVILEIGRSSIMAVGEYLCKMQIEFNDQEDTDYYLVMLSEIYD